MTLSDLNKDHINAEDIGVMQGLSFENYHFKRTDQRSE